VNVPDLAGLCVMSIEELEDLLVDLMAERLGMERSDLLKGPMLDGSLRTRSILMVALMNQIAKIVGCDIIRSSDLDDAKRLRTARGTAEVLKEALERLVREAS